LGKNAQDLFKNQTFAEKAAEKQRTRDKEALSSLNIRAILG
jgi:hypothetical protein